MTTNIFTGGAVFGCLVALIIMALVNMHENNIRWIVDGKNVTTSIPMTATQSTCELVYDIELDGNLGVAGDLLVNGKLKSIQLDAISNDVQALINLVGGGKWEQVRAATYEIDNLKKVIDDNDSINKQTRTWLCMLIFASSIGFVVITILVVWTCATSDSLAISALEKKLIDKIDKVEEDLEEEIDKIYERKEKNRIDATDNNTTKPEPKFNLKVKVSHDGFADVRFHQIDSNSPTSNVEMVRWAFKYLNVETTDACYTKYITIPLTPCTELDTLIGHWMSTMITDGEFRKLAVDLEHSHLPQE